MRHRYWLVALAGGISAWAQLAPMIAPRSIVNAASLIPISIPGGFIAQGSMFSIFGTDLGPAQPLSQNGFPLNSTLGNIVVRVIQGTTTLNAIPIYVSAMRIDAIMPSNAPLGMVSIQAANGAVRGNMAPARVTDASFGIFTANTFGIGPGQFMNMNDDGSTTQNTTASPAIQGQTIMLTGTGLGAIAGPDNQAPADGDNPPAAVEVFVGGESAMVVSSGRSGAAGGQDQVTFQIPGDALLGCYVPVLVRLNGTIPSNTATIAISSDGSACSDPANPLSAAIINGGKLGIAVSLRSSVREDIATKGPLDVVSDNAALYLRAETGGPQAFNTLFSLPPPGSCTALSGGGDWFSRSALPGTDPAGYLTGPPAVNVTARGGSKLAQRGTASLSMTALGSKVSFLTKAPSTLILSPGDLLMTSGGSGTIGSINVKTSMPAVPNWIDRDTLSTVDRTKDLTLNFDPAGDGQTMLIFGGAVDVPTYSTAMFACVVPPQTTSFTVPAAVLSTMPASRYQPIQSKAVIYLGLASPVVSFSPTGLDAGVGVAIALNGKTVSFK